MSTERTAIPAPTDLSVGTPASVGLWARRLAWWTWFAAIPLVFFGSSVTSLHAGLAIDGWLVVDPGKGDWFMPLYPLDRWVHSLGAFVEHTHRLFGMLVGVLAIATVVAAARASRAAVRHPDPRVRRASTSAAILAGAALLAVIVQGVLGGFRVLEKSTDLAFLHGAFGQAVFLLLGLTALALDLRPVSRAPASADGSGTRRADVKLKRIARATVVVVYLQIVVGAWLRHGQSLAALVTHILMLIAVSTHMILLSVALTRAAQDAADAPRLYKLRTWLWITFATQLALGMLAFLWVYLVVGRDRTPTELHQSFFPTMHVLGGAALLFVCAAATLQSVRRLRGSPVAVESIPARAELGGTR